MFIDEFALCMLLDQVYCYCTSSYMITFERELISEPEEDDEGRMPSTYYRSPLSFDDYDRSRVSSTNLNHLKKARKNEGSDD